MKNIIKGEVLWKFGDNFDADYIVPAEYRVISDREVLAKVCLIDYDPEFPQRVTPGDILIAGQNFGYGHPHISGLRAFLKLGIGALVAESFAPAWYRTAISSAFPVLRCPDITKKADKGHQLQITFKTGKIKNLTTGETISAEPLHPILMDIIGAGGMRAYADTKLRAEGLQK